MKKDDQQNSRESILAAAVELFAKQGFNGTSIAAVAKQAEQSKALVQYHFETKERLWKETVSHIWQQRNNSMTHYLGEDLLTAPAGKDHSQMVRQLCKGLIQFTIANPEWVKILYQESVIPGPRLDWMIETFLKTDLQQGVDLVKLAQSLNLLPSIDPMSMQTILIGALIHYVSIAPLTSRILGRDMFSDKQIDHFVDNFILLLEGAPSQRA